MKKKVLFSLLALTASAFADGDMIAAQVKSDMQSNMNQQQMPNVVTLTSARPESDNGWYLFADALYWRADVGNTDWSFKNTDVNAVDEVVRGPNHKLDFKWSWGFRVGIGANIDHDMWDTNFYYTWFRSENSNSVGTDGPNELAVDNQGSVGNAGPSTRGVSQGKIEWNIHYSMFDWELGRWFHVSRSLSLRPHVGIKGGWINQKVNRDWTINRTTEGEADLENDFWGVGAAGGFNSTWMLGHVGRHHFSLFGDFAGALMYGHFDVDHKEEVEINEVVVGGNNIRNLDRNLAVPMLQAMFGLGWDLPFNRDRCHFGLKVGYEFQYWFRQNQMLNIKNGSPANTVQYWRNSDDLALQGLTVDFRFDF